MKRRGDDPRQQPDESRERMPRPSNRRTRSVPRLLAAAIFVLGSLIIGVAVLSMYEPETVDPVGVDPNPLFGLTMLTAAGVSLVLFSILLYLYARRSGV